MGSGRNKDMATQIETGGSSAGWTQVGHDPNYIHFYIKIRNLLQGRTYKDLKSPNKDGNETWFKKETWVVVETKK